MDVPGVPAGPGDQAPARSRRSFRPVLVHAIRLAMLAGIVACIHLQHRRLERSASAAGTASTTQADGLAFQTSPDSDHIIGFSGPTNLQIRFDDDGKVSRVEILSSGDTRDHVDQIRQQAGFLDAWNGKTWEQAPAVQPDAVSGATLTSYAMIESVANRLGGDKPSLRFPSPPNMAVARKLFPESGELSIEPQAGAIYVIRNAGGPVGRLLSSSPAADQEIGYQGPTRSWLGLDQNDRIIGLAIGPAAGESFDNEPYVTYVRDDDYFLSRFNGLTVKQLSTLDLQQHGVEGVSGATMTSMAVAYGIQEAATKHLQRPQVKPAVRSPLMWSWKEAVTICVLLLGVVIGLTGLRSNRLLRIVFQIIVVAWLGFINGALISQVMLVGWAENSIPWRSAIGLVLLTAAAFMVPITTKRNVYCNHLCPHGAVQQWTRSRLRWRVKIPTKLNRVLLWIPGLLLLLVLIVVMWRLPVNLVDIEPFDAWLFRIAGWSSIAIAVVGLIASLFIPMAYCRYGCPTGALIELTRYHARADRIGLRDLLVVAALMLSLSTLW